LFWGVTGVALGAVVGVSVVRWVNKTKQKYSPPNVARSAGKGLAGLGERLRDAVAAGAEEMVAREAELRAELNLPRD
jgi:hypothetical protein